MGIRLDEMGGTDWVDGNVLTAIDLNDSMAAVLNAGVSGHAVNAYKTLDASGVFENGDGIAADKFTTESGVNGTLGYISPNYAYTEGTIVETSTLSIPLNNPENAFDNDNSTYAEYINYYNNNTTSTLGKTFTERYIEGVFYKFQASRDNYNAAIVVKIQTYNGSTWSDFSTLFNALTQNTGIVEGLIYLNSNVQGIRLSITVNTGGLVNYSHKYYELSYGDLIAPAGYNLTTYTTSGGGGGTLFNESINYVENSPITDGQSYKLGISYNTDATIHNPSTFTNPENAFDVDNSTFSNVSMASGATRNVYLGETFTERYIEGVYISAEIYTGASNTSTISAFYLEIYNGSTWSNFGTLFNAGAMRTCWINGLVKINLTCQGVRLRFEYNNDTTGTARVYSFLCGGRSSESILYTNVTNNLDNTESIAGLYMKGEIPTNTDIKADITDGTTTISDVEFDSKGRALADISSLGAGTLQIKWKLTTTDTSVTPKLYGYGVYLS